MVFVFLWTTFVYDFIAYWSWSSSGWLAKLGALDYAGGTIVHISSGVAGAVFSFFLDGFKKKVSPKEGKKSNIINVFIGTALLWFGWFGFNGASGYKADVRAGYAFVNTHLAASVGGMVWVILENEPFSRIKNGNSKKWRSSSVGFCTGAVCGLVSITPGSGFVDIWSSIVFGVFGPMASYYASSAIEKKGFKDYLGVFGCHGVSGIVGSVLTGIFASKKVAGFGEINIKGGWVDGNFVQVPIQLLSTVVSFAWSGIITLIICYAINIFECMKFKLDVEDNVDHLELGEYAYNYSKINSSYDEDKGSENNHSGSSTETREESMPENSTVRNEGRFV
ncbi:Ammonium transporter 1 [Smittium culicis]|uniref:Ammonium transporter 1 n=1 Tax=Smittium culicis TaxID=133412 RepID=A0A1R1Y378_9FUNG|nr:Ammonium transporter 1 [Smittium culicis]